MGELDTPRQQARPKPALQRLFELAAAAMDLDHGQERLELTFVDGHLVKWWAHRENRPARELERFDDRVPLRVIAPVAGAE